MLSLKSTAFEEGAEIPARYTCEGDNVSPTLHWSGVPARTKSLVLIMDDPDAPDPAAPKRVWTHWLLYNIPPYIETLCESVTKLPDGTLQGVNDWKRKGYGGPCPPRGRHRYFHKLYALDTVLEDLEFPDKQKLLNAMSGHVLADTHLMGTYRKK